MRILTFHDKDAGAGGQRFGATYYVEQECIPVATRIHAEQASVDGELEVDIFSDDVSIFKNQAASHRQLSTTKGATVTYDTASTTLSMEEDQNTETLASNDFVEDSINEGSWIHCEIINARGAKNLSVHLILEELGEEE